MKYVLAIAFAVAAFNAPAMAVDLNAQIRQLDGSPLTDPTGKPTPTSLAQICEAALLATYPDDQTATGDQKNDRFKLAKRIHQSGGDLTPDEIATLKTLIGKAFNPIIVGRSWELLDGPPQTKN